MTQSIIKITSPYSSCLLTGPIQFSTDWPGTFFTLAYIKNQIVNQDREQSDTVKNVFDFTKNYITNFCKDLADVAQSFDIDDSKEDIVYNIQKVEVTALDIDNKPVQRVETGIVNINGQIGYFMRGDNSSYLAYALSLKNPCTPFEESLKKFLGGCIL